MIGKTFVTHYRGTWSTIDHVLTPGERSEAGEGKNEHIAVRSYAKMMESIDAEAIIKKEEIYSIKLISKIQKVIVESDPNSPGVPGKLRTPESPGSIVTIGGMNRKENSTYNPAPPGEVKRCLSEVVEWLKDEDLALQGDAGSGLSLPVRLAVGHAHFGAVHPFTDGNGRAGHALWAVQMICAGSMPLYLSGYVEARKALMKGITLRWRDSFLVVTWKSGSRTINSSRELIRRIFPDSSF